MHVSPAEDCPEIRLLALLVYYSCNDRGAGAKPQTRSTPPVRMTQVAKTFESCVPCPQASYVQPGPFAPKATSPRRKAICLLGLVWVRAGCSRARHPCLAPFGDVRGPLQRAPTCKASCGGWPPARGTTVLYLSRRWAPCKGHLRREALSHFACEWIIYLFVRFDLEGCSCFTIVLEEESIFHSA